MSGASDPRSVVARSVLLDALEALGAQREAVVLVGAQAIYMHTGALELAVAEFTTDGHPTCSRPTRGRSAVWRSSFCSSPWLPATSPHVAARRLIPLQRCARSN